MAAKGEFVRGALYKGPTPPTQSLENRPEGFTPGCEMKQSRRDGRRRGFAVDDSTPLKLAEAVGEKVRRDARQPILQVCIAAGSTNQKLADDKQCPTVTDDIQGSRDRAVLVVGTHLSGFYRRVRKNSSYELTYSSLNFSLLAGTHPLGRDKRCSVGRS
jgi:hypothetical protein